MGFSGISNDMRELLSEKAKKNERAHLAVEMFCYRVRKYIGAYLAALGGADVVIFTGGIGENSPAVRAEICAGLEALGIRIDTVKNEAACGSEAEISAEGSPISLWWCRRTRKW